MENGPVTLGLEDGAIDVARLLVEPQDGHVSMDSVMCFNEKVPDNSRSMEEVSCSFGGSNHDFAEQEKDILNGEVLDGMPSEEVGYFRLQNDFCSMGDEYLLGVEFAESITNLDYSSSERLTSVSDSLILASCAGTGSPWKSDLFRMEVNVCQSDQLNVGRSELGNISSKHEFDTLATEKPTSCNLRDLDKFHDISSCSFEEVLSDGNDGSVYTLPEMLCSPKDEKNAKFELTGKDSKTSKFERRNELATISAQGDQSDTSPAQKRSRKPTRRYINEFEDPILRFPKKRRGVSSSTTKIKDQGAKGHKKCRLGSSVLILPVEETSVKAIQVPFAAVVRNECPKSEAQDMVRGKEGGNLITRPKDTHATPDNQNKGDECITPFHKNRSHNYVAASEKRREDGVSVAYLKKRSERHAGASQKKRGDFVISMSPMERVDLVRTVSEKKRDNFVIATNPKKKAELAIIASDKKGDDCCSITRRKKRDDFITSESIEDDVIVRRKHHILWTIAEVKKLLDGVSQYGVGRWSRIKKLFFSQSAHRTSVDLKDKWRNLLKASGILERGKGQGRKKRNAAWRPLPKSILGQVCELAAMHPYPKGRRPEISHNSHDSPDRSTDITLSDYRKIIRSISSY